MTAAAYQPPPCLHKIADHQCGTHARYVRDRCRCDACRAANSEYEKERSRWAREFPYVDPPLVPAGPARRHVRGLTSQGMGLKRIAEVSGVAHGALWKLMYGKVGPRGGKRPSKRVRRETAAKLLAVELDLAMGAKVDGTEAQSIIDELKRRGWTGRAIARRVTGRDTNALQAGRGSEVFVSTLLTLRGLLNDPVPPRRSTRGLYAVHYVQPRDVLASTRGVPGSIPKPSSRGVLLCEVCREALRDHSVAVSCYSRDGAR